MVERISEYPNRIRLFLGLSSPTFWGQIPIRHYLYPTFSKIRANFKKISGYSKKIFDFLGIRIWLFEISNYPNRSESDSLPSDDIHMRLFDIRSTTTYSIYWENIYYLDTDSVFLSLRSMGQLCSLRHNQYTFTLQLVAIDGGTLKKCWQSLQG